ncbi:hypothetical protein TNCV_397941 [Trichonephila clavipes]|nr:hypothetical protein TNCV_397941 [Trichonephila clavipes]
MFGLNAYKVQDVLNTCWELEYRLDILRATKRGAYVEIYRDLKFDVNDISHYKMVSMKSVGYCATALKISSSDGVVVRITNSWLESATEYPPCRGGQCTLNLS